MARFSTDPPPIPRNDWWIVEAGHIDRALTFVAKRTGGYWVRAVVGGPRRGIDALYGVLTEAFFSTGEPFNLDDLFGWIDLSGLPLHATYERERPPKIGFNDLSSTVELPRVPDTLSITSFRVNGEDFPIDPPIVIGVHSNIGAELTERMGSR